MRLRLPLRQPQRRVVAEDDEIGALQSQDPVDLGPPTVVAQAHADPQPVDLEHAETKVADLEVVLLQVLGRRLPHRRGVTGQMDLAVLADDLPRAVHQDRGVVAVPVGRQLGVTKVETDPQRAGAVEQRLHRRVGHGALVEVVGRGDVRVPVAREERRQRQLGKHHEASRPLRRGLE